MKKTITILLALAFAAAFAYFGPLGGKLPGHSKPDQGAAAVPGTGGTEPAAPAKAAAYEKKETYFKLGNAAGGELDLASYAGKPVFVFFFTETCPYCRKAGPAMEKFYKAYGPKGLNIIGVSLEDSPEGARNFAKSLGVTFPLAYDGGDTAARYRAQGVPYIYALDRRHKIYDVWEGYDSSYDPQIEKTIKDLLSKK